MVHTIFGVKKEISREVIQRSTLMGNSRDWHGMWEKMGHFWKDILSSKGLEGPP